MTALCYDMIRKEMEVYLDDMIFKSLTKEYHLADLKMIFERLRKDDLKLNPVNVFTATSCKLGFIFSRCVITIDPTEIKSITEVPAPRMERGVKGFLVRLNYIGRFIAQLTTTCKPLFKLLRKNTPVVWNKRVPTGLCEK